jgi:hypothetical protein
MGMAVLFLDDSSRDACTRTACHGHLAREGLRTFPIIGDVAKDSKQKNRDFIEPGRPAQRNSSERLYRSLYESTRSQCRRLKKDSSSFS